MEINTDEIGVTILAEHNGEMHLVSMKRESLDAIEFLVRRNVVNLHKTDKNINELRQFLGLDKS